MFCIPICCIVIILIVFFCFIKKANDYNATTVQQPRVPTNTTVNPTNVTFTAAHASSPATVTYQQNTSLQQEPPPAYSVAAAQPANPAYPPLQNPPQQTPYPSDVQQQGPSSSEVYPPQQAAMAYPPYPQSEYPPQSVQTVGYPQDSEIDEKKTSDFNPTAPPAYP